MYFDVYSLYLVFKNFLQLKNKVIFILINHNLFYLKKKEKSFEGRIHIQALKRKGQKRVIFL